MQLNKQPWLGRPVKECIFILAPALLPVAMVFIFRDYFLTAEVSTWWWVLLVLCIDVSHVYSTLFRLYWDRSTFQKYKRVLIVIPVVALMVGIVLHYYDSLVFWRVLAYIAVFHFVRQQYGFMRLYSRKELPSKWNRFVDSISVYNATIYPLLFWHIHATDKLSWFVKGDFIPLHLQPYEDGFTLLYLLIILVYVVKELVQFYKTRFINIPKNLLLTGTYASWYVGIVAFQGDLIFTLLNVVAHGIPYMALIWIHGEKRTQSEFAFNLKGVGIFAITLLVLAYLEENFWDTFIWQDHPELFPLFSNFVALQNPLTISVVVSFLVLPQITHYILDGFIWRFSKDVQARI